MMIEAKSIKMDFYSHNSSRVKPATPGSYARYKQTRYDEQTKTATHKIMKLDLDIAKWSNDVSQTSYRNPKACLLGRTNDRKFTNNWHIIITCHPSHLPTCTKFQSKKRARKSLTFFSPFMIRKTILSSFLFLYDKDNFLPLIQVINKEGKRWTHFELF